MTVNTDDAGSSFWIDTGTEEQNRACAAKASQHGACQAGSPTMATPLAHRPGPGDESPMAASADVVAAESLRKKEL